jgi:GxxExxY protein
VEEEPISEREVQPLDRVTEAIIGAAIEVHKHLGPGLMESAYEECLCYELSHLGLGFRRQVSAPVPYKGLKLDCGYKIDILVEDEVILELKSVEHLLPLHTSQLITYLKLADKRVGLLINFNEVILTKGLKRLVNHYPKTSAPSASLR